MGSRAIITSAPFDQKNVGIYVHWNGGRASIKGFCRAAAILAFRSPDRDDSYGLARLTQLIGTFFGPDGLSVGIGIVEQLVSENGVYVIGTDAEGRDWQIVERRGYRDEDGTAEPWGLLDLEHIETYDEVDEAKSQEICDIIVAKTLAAAAAAAAAADA